MPHFLIYFSSRLSKAALKHRCLLRRKLAGKGAFLEIVCGPGRRGEETRQQKRVGPPGVLGGGSPCPSCLPVWQRGHITSSVGRGSPALLPPSTEGFSGLLLLRGGPGGPLWEGGLRLFSGLHQSFGGAARDPPPLFLPLGGGARMPRGPWRACAEPDLPSTTRPSAPFQQAPFLGGSFPNLAPPRRAERGSGLSGFPQRGGGVRPTSSPPRLPKPSRPGPPAPDKGDRRGARASPSSPPGHGTT